MTEPYKVLEKRIEKLEKDFEHLQNEYCLEKVKVGVYREIIRNNTFIKLDNFKDQTNVEVNTCIGSKHTSIPVDTEPIIVNRQSLQIQQTNIDDLFNKIKENKSYNKYLTKLKQLRGGLFESINLTEYIDICAKHISTLKQIFVEKGFTPKKIKTTVVKSMSPLELRLTRYENYYDSCLDKDEIRILKKAVYLSNNFPEKYEPLNTTDIQQRLSNYSSIVSSVEEIITNCLVNNKGFHNIIYLPLLQSNESDPYSFYVLEEIAPRNIKKWKMDCRLEDLTLFLRDSLLEYLISSFRVMYFDIFSDNEYRPEYKKQCQASECDMAIISRNIYFLLDLKKINKMVRKIVKDNCSQSDTNNPKDKFNIRTDDPLHNDNYYASNQITKYYIVRRIFDNVNNNETFEL